MTIIKVYLIGCAFSLIFAVISMILSLRKAIREKGIAKVSIEDIYTKIFDLIFCASLSWCVIILFLYLIKDETLFTLKNKNYD